MNQGLRFAFFCHPKTQSWLPGMFRTALRHMRLPHTCEVVQIPDLVRLETMVDTIRQGVLAGAVVASPYKASVLTMVDEVDKSAEELGAANLLVPAAGRVIAYSTEASALASDLGTLGASGQSAAAIIGSGEAALAAVLACGRIGVKVIVVTSQAWQNSEELVSSDTSERFRHLGALPCTWPGARAEQAATTKMSEVLRLHWPDIAASSSILIQATSAGMRPSDPGETVAEIVPWGRLNKDALAYDLVYTGHDTPFLRAARERGLRAAGGFGTLVGQGAYALSLWLQVNPDIDLMRLAAEQALLVGHR